VLDYHDYEFVQKFRKNKTLIAAYILKGIMPFIGNLDNIITR
jgi:hypothetical protein